MALILLERKTVVKETVRTPRSREFAYYTLTETTTNFNTDTKAVEITSREYKETNEKTGDHAVKTPFYINPAAEFYSHALSSTSFRVYSYLGSGIVTHTDVAAGIGCNLQITQPVTITPDTGGGVGTATISVTGQNSGVFQYGVAPRGSNAVVWQASNAITGLAFGYYTVYAHDLNTNCKAKADVFISDVKVYGARYFVEFTRVTDSALCRLEIHRKNYEGPAEDLGCVSADPIQINKSDSNDKYEAIKATQADIGLISFTRQKFLEFFSADERHNRIDLTVNGHLYHRSWVLPDVYREPFLAAPYEVSLTGSDGLNTLKNYPYTDAAGAMYTGERTWLDIVFDCLDKLDLDLPLTTAVDVYEAGMFQTSDKNHVGPVISDPLAQASVNTEMFRDDKGLPRSCDFVMRAVLETLKARIYQSHGWWVLECIDAKRTEIFTANYNPDRSFKGYWVFNPVIPTSRPNTGGLQWIGGGQGLDINPAWKKVVIESNLAVKENILTGGLLRDVDFEDTGALALAQLKGWTGSAPYSRIKEGKGKNSISFNTPQPGPLSLDTAKYWQSAAYPLVKDDTASLLITIEYELVTNTADGIPPRFSCTLKRGDQVADSYVVDGRTFAAPRGSAEFVLEPGVHTLEIEAPIIREDGNYHLVITEAYKGYDYSRPDLLPMQVIRFRLKKATMRVLPGGKLPNEYVDVTITNPERYTYTPGPEEMVFVDVPENPNYAQTYKNYISVNGQQSKSWAIKGAAPAEEGGSALISLIAANVAYNYSRPTHRLSGTLRGALNYQQVIRERWDKNRLFMFDGMQENVRQGTFQITMHELVMPTGSTGNPAIDSGLALLTEDRAFFLLSEDNQYILMTEDIIE